MDVARKYLQMGYTRSRRYAKYEGGNKSKPLEKPNPQKSRAAESSTRSGVTSLRTKST